VLFVFCLNNKEIMLQQRAHHKIPLSIAMDKHLTSHQREGTFKLGLEALYEEMSFTTELKELFHLYTKPLLIVCRLELDHVLLGIAIPNLKLIAMKLKVGSG
jgi:isopentenyl-diphosphate delta-isomerase